MSEGNKILVKVKLHTADGKFVAEAYSLPYQSWPQAFTWGLRTFARENFREMSHKSSDPPLYYECIPLAAYSKEDLASLGVV